MNRKQLNALLKIMESLTTQEQFAELASIALLAMYNKQDILGFTTKWISVDPNKVLLHEHVEAKIKVDFRKPKLKGAKK